MKERIKYIKLDEDDILEILIEHFQDQEADFIFGKGIILGTPQRDLKFIGVLSTEEVFEEARNTDLEELDKNMEYNGFHSYVKSHPECWLKTVGQGGDPLRDKEGQVDGSLVPSRTDELP